MLQETLDNWKVYHNTYEQLERWLNEGDQVLQRSPQEKLVSSFKHYFLLEINDVSKLFLKEFISDEGIHIISAAYRI